MQGKIYEIFSYHFEIGWAFSIMFRLILRVKFIEQMVMRLFLLLFRFMWFKSINSHILADIPNLMHSDTGNHRRCIVHCFFGSLEFDRIPDWPEHPAQQAKRHSVHHRFSDMAFPRFLSKIRMKLRGHDRAWNTCQLGNRLQFSQKEIRRYPDKSYPTKNKRAQTCPFISWRSFM